MPCELIADEGTCAVLESEAVAAPIATYPACRRRWLRRGPQRRAFAVTAAALLVSAGMLIVPFLSRSHTTRQPPEDVHSTAEAAAAKALRQFLVLDTLTPPSADTPEQQHMSHRQKLVQVSKRAAMRFKHEPLVEATIRIALGSAFRGYREYKLAEAEFQRAVDLRSEHLGAEHPDTLLTKYLLANCYIHQGKSEQALSLATHVADARQRVLGDTDQATLWSRDQIGRAYEAGYRYRQAAQVWEPLVEQMEALRIRMDAVNLVKLRLAMAHKMIGESSRAEALLLDLLEEQRERLGMNHSATLHTAHQLTAHYCEQGKLELAERLQRGVLQRLEAGWGPDYSLALAARGALAIIYGNQGRLEDAESLYLQTLAGEQRLKGPNQAGDLVTLCQYARILRATQRYEEAEAVMRYVLARHWEQHGDGSPLTVSSLYTMASIFRAQEKRAQEMLWQIRTLVSRYRVHGPFHQETVNTQRQLLRALHRSSIETLTTPWYDSARQCVDWMRSSRPMKMPLVVMDQESQQLALRLVDEAADASSLAVLEGF